MDSLVRAVSYRFQVPFSSSPGQASGGVWGLCVEHDAILVAAEHYLAGRKTDQASTGATAVTPERVDRVAVRDLELTDIGNLSGVGARPCAKLGSAVQALTSYQERNPFD